MNPNKFVIDTIGWTRRQIQITLPTEEIIFLNYDERPADIKITLYLVPCATDESLTEYLCNKLRLQPTDHFVEQLMSILRMFKWALRQEPKTVGKAA